MRCLALALLCSACGPVGSCFQNGNDCETPTQATARRAVVAALRAAVADVCRATLPPLDAHPMARIAWGMVCQPATLPPVDHHGDI